MDLESLLASKNIQKNPVKQKAAKTRHLLAITRDADGKTHPIYADTNRFQSERNIDSSNYGIMFGPGWLADRVMEEIPLYVSGEQVTARRFTADYSRLPSDLTDILNHGILRTSGTIATDYSILMSVTEKNDGKPPEGRTGVLLYQGKPITIQIDGKDFVVEIKGVGCPDADNSRIEQMCRSDYFGQGHEEIGGFDLSEGKREFANLETQRKRKITSFQTGDSIRAAGIFSYETEKTYKTGETKKVRQAYLLRLAPTNIRSSFNSNPNFPKVEDREMLLSTSIGQHYAELAKLEETLLHSTIHPENMVWTGSRYVLTDFADCRRLADISNPHDFLNKVLKKVTEVPGLTRLGENNFYATIAKELGVEWNVNTGYNGFIDSIWSGYFAQKVYASRKGKTTSADIQIDAAKSLIKLYKRNETQLDRLFVNGAKRFLEKEIDVLEHIPTPEAKASIHVAKQRIEYLTTQLDDSKDINSKFKQNPETFYDLFRLPYMKK